MWKCVTTSIFPLPLRGRAETKSGVLLLNMRVWKNSVKSIINKVLIIVNTGLEELYKKYYNKGLDILDFHCNKFGHEASNNDDEEWKFLVLHVKSQKILNVISLILNFKLIKKVSSNNFLLEDIHLLLN
ncbi:hypothetical protein U3516DRAFT_766232 [Neocallimastix sp. 'constans']